MGYNVSKSKRLPSKTKSYRYEPIENPRAVKVFHNNQYKRKKISRRGKRQRNPLQEEYDAWLRSLSLDPEYYEISSPKSAWKENRDPWHATLQKKVSSLLRSKKHRQEAMVWPQQFIEESKKKKGKNKFKPPAVRLAFVDEEQKMQEIRKHMNMREPNERAFDKHHLRSKKVHPSKRNSLSIAQQRSHQSSLLTSRDSGCSSNRSTNSEIRTTHQKKYQKKKDGSNTSLHETHLSNNRSSNEENVYCSSSNERTRKNFRHSRDGNQSDQKYRWEDNTIQGGAFIVGPRVLPFEDPGMEPRFPTIDLSNQKRFKKRREHAYHNDMRNPFGMSGFQMIDNDVKHQDTDDTSSRSTTPNALSKSYDPKLNRIITEVGEDFKTQFSTLSKSEDWELQHEAHFTSSSIDSLLSEDHNVSLQRNKLLAKLTSEQVSDINESETLRLSTEANNSQADNNYLEENMFKENRRSWPNKSTDLKERMKFGPGSENFFLARTSELCTKTITEELHRLGFNNATPRVNFPSISSKTADFRNTSSSDDVTQKGFLWRRSDPMVSSLNSFQDGPSAYKLDDTAEDNLSTSNYLNNSSATYREDIQPFIAERRMNQRYFSKLNSGYDSDTSSTDSLRDHKSTRGDAYNESSLVKSSLHQRRRRKPTDFTRSATNFEDINNTMDLESKIDRMVKSMIGEKLGIPENKPNPIRRRKKRRAKRQHNHFSAQEIEAIIEDQLTAALTSALVPKK